MFDQAPQHLGLPSIFDRLPDRVRACLIAASKARHFARGETICLQGEPAVLKVVQSGWVKLYRMSLNGDEAVLETVAAGCSFDEIAALHEGASPASAEAVSDCTVLFINLAAIHHCEGAYREVNKAVLQAASGHFDAMLGEIEQLKVKTGAQRLCEYLLLLTDVGVGAVEITLPYEKTLLAAKLGMKPESLSRAFRRLKTAGVDSKLRQVSIRDIAGLRALALEDPEFA